MRRQSRTLVSASASPYIPDDGDRSPFSPLLLTRKQVACLLGVSMRTVSRLVATNAVPKPIRLSRLVRWRRAEIEHFVVSRLNTSTGVA